LAKPVRVTTHPTQVTRTGLAPALLALASIYAVGVAIACSSLLEHRGMAVAVSFDLTATSALAFWWLAIRPGHARP
jgi:hypothetical protein